MTSKEKFYDLWSNVVLKNFPTAKIKFKNESIFMRILGSLLFFNKNFMTRYTTVIGKTIYFPSRVWQEESYSRATAVVCHEFVHMFDVNKFMYLSPQIWSIFSLFSVLAIVNIWFLLFLTFLICLVPWPSPWRTNYESNGYAMNMFFEAQTRPGYYPKRAAEGYSEQFVGSGYYFMSWNRFDVVVELLYKYETLPKTHKGFLEVSKWLKTLPYP